MGASSTKSFDLQDWLIVILVSLSAVEEWLTNAACGPAGPSLVMFRWRSEEAPSTDCLRYRTSWDWKACPGKLGCYRWTGSSSKPWEQRKEEIQNSAPPWMRHLIELLWSFELILTRKRGFLAILVRLGCSRWSCIPSRSCHRSKPLHVERLRMVWSKWILVVTGLLTEWWVSSGSQYLEWAFRQALCCRTVPCKCVSSVHAF